MPMNRAKFLLWVLVWGAGLAVGADAQEPVLKGSRRHVVELNRTDLSWRDVWARVEVRWTRSVSERLGVSDEGVFPNVARILFLGDSITYSGHFVTLLETAVRLQQPERKVELLNLGLPSETVSGLSEPGHAGGQFPRPDLHERLTRVLDQVQPDLVVACYGMNDGIYYPLSEERFAAYRGGIERLRDEVQRRGVKLVLLTPAMFDAQPIANRLLPAGQAAYPQPYADYDEVLQQYAAWLLGRGRVDGWQVLDVHGAMRRAVVERRESDPDFTFAADGVHPNEAGQAVIAGVLARHWGLDLGESDTGIDAEERRGLRVAVGRLVAERQALLKHAWLTRTGHLRPGLPAGLEWEQAQSAADEMQQRIARLV